MSRKRAKPPADVGDGDGSESGMISTPLMGGLSSSVKRQRMISRNGNAPSHRNLKLIINNNPSSSNWFGCQWIAAELSLIHDSHASKKSDSAVISGVSSRIKDSSIESSSNSSRVDSSDVCSEYSGTIHVRLVFENGESVPEDFDFTVRQNGIEQRPQSQIVTEFDCGDSLMNSSLGNMMNNNQNGSSMIGGMSSEFDADGSSCLVPRSSHLNCCSVTMSEGICKLEVRMNSLSMYHENRSFKLVYSVGSLSYSAVSPSSSDSITMKDHLPSVRGCQSSVFRLVKNKLIVVRQPLAKFFKDEGGKGNCLECELSLIDNCRNVETKRGKIALSVRLLYSDDLSPAQSQRDILEVLTSNPELVHGKCVLHFRINEVSKNHNKRAFCLSVECSANEPLYQDISPAVTQPIMVYSKRTKKAAMSKRRRSHAHFADGGGNGSSSSFRSHRGGTDSMNGDLPPGVDTGAGFIPPHIKSGALPGAPIVLPFSARIRDKVFKREEGGTKGESKGVFHTMIEWCQLAAWVMRILEWVHCGYEMDPSTGAIDPRRPLYRCCFCLKYRNCAGFGTHESDCQLRLALDQYTSKLNNLPNEFAFQSTRTDTAMASTDGASMIPPPPPQSLLAPSAAATGAPSSSSAAAAAAAANNALIYGAMNPVVFPGMNVGGTNLFGTPNTFRPFQSPSSAATSAAAAAANAAAAASASHVTAQPPGHPSMNHLGGSLQDSSQSSSRSGSSHHPSAGLSRLQAKLPGELQQISSVSKERSDYGFPAFDRSQKLVGFIDDSGLRNVEELGMSQVNSDLFLNSADNMLFRSESNPFHFTEGVTKMVSSGYGLDKH